MTGIFIRRWAGVLTAFAAMLAGCGGGGTETVTAALTAPLVSKLDGRVQPADVDHGVVSIKKRAASAAPVPSKVRLGALVDAKKLPLVAASGRQQIGISREVAATKNPELTHQQLQWKLAPAGGYVSAISFSADGAYGIRLGLLVQQIAGGAQLRLYRQTDVGTVFQISGQELLQHMERNIAAGDATIDAKTWWTPDLGGDEVTLEIELPAGIPVASIDISVPRVSHIFEDVSVLVETDIHTKINESSACQLDASCYETYLNQRNAVARMSFVSEGGSYLCSGTLLNNTQASGLPYFLTANHCISTQSEASSLQTDWFYRAPTCNSRTLSTGTVRRVGGAQLLYANSSNDMTLLRLNDTPPAGAYFAGWDASAQVSGQSVVGLHHPRGDLLKASFGTLIGQATCSEGAGGISCRGTPGNFYQVIWNQGTTQQGSSGSAIFKDGVYVIGTLYAGSATCSTAASPDFYGRFDIGFNAALKNWLAPAASPSVRAAVYRFYNSKTGAHFYTASASERDFVIRTYPDFAYENIAFYAYPDSSTGKDPVFRFYNPTSGAHFYSGSVAERDFVIANFPEFKYEVVSWYAQTGAGNGASPIYRFYNATTGAHFYTISAAERDFVIQVHKAFRYEGPMYYAWTTAQ